MNNQPQFQKIERRVEYKIMPSGQTVEFCWLKIIRSSNQSIIKDETIRVTPPLSDGRTVETVDEVRECRVCTNLYHSDNIFQCSVCGDYACRKCFGEVEVDGQAVSACKRCQEELTAGIFKRLWHKLWNLER
jgi:hypothetical protein